MVLFLELQNQGTDIIVKADWIILSYSGDL